MTVVNFLCRREKAIMKKKAKITTSVLAAVIFLRIIALSNQGLQEPPVPEVRPVSASFASNRDNTPPTENKAVVADKSAKVGTQNPPQDSALTENDLEPPSKADSKEILAESSTPRDNHTPTPAPSKNTTVTKACEPKMDDTRTVDGQKQSFFIGFGWIDDNDKPNECIYVEDMYENGNKIGSMGGGTFLDGEGDINKMVGRMD